MISIYNLNYIVPLLLVNLLLIKAESVVVTVEQGQLRGEVLQVVTGDVDYVSFKGIPYAKPPVGDLRFTAPEEPESWTGVRNATEHGSTCVQINIGDPSANPTGSEDCLYLNVYTPNVNPETYMPVMLYIHGGAYQSGSGNSERYGPDYLIPHNVVLVTINYRLGPIGFLSLNTAEVPGNAGLKDQVLAMKWVKNNIVNFGGDSNKITIFGQSAGGASVGFHNLSPMTKGLYNRSVAMSGSPLDDWSIPLEPRRGAFRLGQQLGLWTEDANELLTFLRSLPAEKLLGTDPAVLRSEYPSILYKDLIFSPIVETDFGEENYLTIDPLIALIEGKVHDVDLMTGHTALEGLTFFVLLSDTVVSLYTNYSEYVVPRKILENTPPANIFNLADKIRTKYFGNKSVDRDEALEFINYISDSAFNYGIIKYARLFPDVGRKFVYKFSIVTDFPRDVNVTNKYGINGADHEDDLLYLFYPQNVNITKGSKDYKLVETVCTLYTNFAKYGNPTPTNNSLGITWPEYNYVNGSYLDINNTLSVGQHLNKEIISFWDSIYEAASLAF